MKKYKIGDLIIQMAPKYQPLKDLVVPYEVKTLEKANIEVPDLESYIKKEQKENPQMTKGNIEYGLYASYIYTYMIEYEAIYLHASTVVVDNKAYLFSAPSGTGKSTHTKLWLKQFPNSYILNDDKPIIRFIDGRAYAYGSPISGKDGISKNKRVLIQGICFIERDKSNWIKIADSKEALTELFKSTVRPFKKELDMILFKVLEKLIKQVKIYKMGLTISKEAVLLAYNTMKGN